MPLTGPAHSILFLPAGFIALIVVIVALVIVVAVVAHFQEKKRSQELQGIAENNGWRFIDRDRKDRPERYRRFTPFGQGHSRYAFNIMTGVEQDTPFELFDYHYAVTTHNGKSSSTQHYYHKVCALKMPLESPGLTIKREHIGHKLLGAVGAGDINFESDEFSRRYWVKSPDRRFAYDVIDARTMQYLLDNQGWHWEWNGDTLIVHRKGKLRPGAARKPLNKALGFERLLPRHLLAEQQVRSR